MWSQPHHSWIIQDWIHCSRTQKEKRLWFSIVCLFPFLYPCLSFHWSCLASQDSHSFPSWLEKWVKGHSNVSLSLRRSPSLSLHVFMFMNIQLLFNSMPVLAPADTANLVVCVKAEGFQQIKLCIVITAVLFVVKDQGVAMDKLTHMACLVCVDAWNRQRSNLFGKSHLIWQLIPSLSGNKTDHKGTWCVHRGTLCCFIFFCTIFCWLKFLCLTIRQE